MPEADEGNEGDRPGVDWTVRLREVERLDREDGDQGEDFFACEFEMSGLGVSGTLTALVTDPSSEETVVAAALEQLQVALGIYAHVVGARKGAVLGSDAADEDVSVRPSLPARVTAVELLLRELLGFSLARAGIVDRAQLATGALEREATLSGDGQRREHAADVRAALERLTE